MDVSAWAVQRFGRGAVALARVVPGAVARAQSDAVAAQAGGGSLKRDTYGHTLKNRQHERLVEVSVEVPGAELFRPAGASFELLGFPATGVVLYPWRYASSTGQRARSRMRSSRLRRDLLAGGRPGTRQLTFDDAARSEAELAEDDAVLAQLRATARVVTLGYASNPRALLELGWGDADLVDEHGTVVWRSWEDLPLDGPAAGVSGLRLAAGLDVGAPGPPWPGRRDPLPGDRAGAGPRRPGSDGPG